MEHVSDAEKAAVGGSPDIEWAYHQQVVQRVREDLSGTAGKYLSSLQEIFQLSGIYTCGNGEWSRTVELASTNHIEAIEYLISFLGDEASGIICLETPDDRANATVAILQTPLVITVVREVLLTSSDILRSRQLQAANLHDYLAHLWELRRTSEALSPFLCVHMSPQGIVRKFNQTVLKTLRVPPDVVRGEQWISPLFIHPDDIDMVRARYRENCGQSFFHEYRLLQRDGIHRLIREFVTPIWDGDGRLVEIAIVGIDMTMDMLLQSTRQYLQPFVLHDLKNPLTSIRGYAEFAISHHDELPKSELVVALRAIHRNALRIIDVIRENLSLEPRDDLGIVLEQFEMGAVVSEALGNLEDKIAKSGAQVELPDTWPEAIGCIHWVQEMWVNYIDNAIKYGEKPPRISLGWKEIEDSGTILFWVYNTGEVVSVRDQMRLFRPESRLDKDSHKDGHGIGLLKVLMYALIQEGTAGMWSGVEHYGGGSRRGTYFAFTLPKYIPPKEKK